MIEIDLSKATKLTEVQFGLTAERIVLAAKMLDGIKSEVFKVVSFLLPLPSQNGRGSNLELWKPLDQALVRLWESRQICVRVIGSLNTDGKQMTREELKGLLPEIAKRAQIEVDFKYESPTCDPDPMTWFEQ